MRRFFFLSLIVILAFSLSVQAQIRVGEFPQDVEDEFNLEPEALEVEVWQQNLDVPWELVFLPKSNSAPIMIITSRNLINKNFFFNSFFTLIFKSGNSVI